MSLNALQAKSLLVVLHVVTRATPSVSHGAYGLSARSRSLPDKPQDHARPAAPPGNRLLGSPPEHGFTRKTRVIKDSLYPACPLWGVQASKGLDGLMATSSPQIMPPMLSTEPAPRQAA